MGSRLSPGQPCHEATVSSVEESSETTTQTDGTQEVPMEKFKSNLQRSGHALAAWLNRNGFGIVVILSILHIGLAFVHSRHSGSTDSPQAFIGGH